MARFVYFIRNTQTGAIKIGVAGRVHARLAVLRTQAAPDRLELLNVADGDMSLERSLHKRFAHLRLTGEWFGPANDLLTYIASLPLRDLSAPEGLTRTRTDPHTEKAGKWVEYIARRESLINGGTLEVCSARVAKRLGLAPGLFYNLRRNRLNGVTVRDYEAIRLAYEAAIESEIADLHRQLDDVLSLAGISAVIERGQSLLADAGGA